MDVIKFTLSGNTAFFKNPEVNAYFYFTYGCIHKIALLGIFGSICGLGGYTQQKDTNEAYPEFYEKLKNLKIGISPLNGKGYIPRKMQIFNNSIGYASKEKGGNLIIKEQWLESPKWDIYIEVNKVTQDLANRLLERRYEYIPYLGKNDHIADIKDIRLIENVTLAGFSTRIDSIFQKDKVEIIKDNDIFNFDVPADEFKYEEMLPITLEEITNNYVLDSFVYTNQEIKPLMTDSIFDCEGKFIYFF